jgi:folate-binding protein YgfZ
MKQISWFEDLDWSLVKVTGDDRVDFLHRLTTNILPSKASPLVHNFFLSVNAKIQAEFWVSAREGYLALLTPTTQVTSLKECIDRYHFGEKIKVEAEDGKLFVVVGADKDALAEQGAVVFAPDPRYGDDCCWCYLESDQAQAFQSWLADTGERMDANAAERRRISLGRPRHGVDYDDESLFVEVAQVDDFSESKGCYPGQEIVARVLHRGRLNKHLRGFESDSVIPPGWYLRMDGKEVASVRSTVPTEDGKSFGYLFVRREYGDDGTELTGVDSAGKEYTLSVTPRPGEVLTGGEE